MSDSKKIVPHIPNASVMPIYMSPMNKISNQLQPPPTLMTPEQFQQLKMQNGLMVQKTLEKGNEMIKSVSIPRFNMMNKKTSIELYRLPRQNITPSLQKILDEHEKQ